MNIVLWHTWANGWLYQSNVNPTKIIIHSVFAPGGAA